MSDQTDPTTDAETNAKTDAETNAKTDAETDAETNAETDAETNAETDDPEMTAYRYPDGSVTYPGHPRGPGGEEQVGTVDLSEYTAEVVTWTTSTATPPGVRQPNHLAIVEFDVDGVPVRALGQLEEENVDIGDTVEPYYVDELRDPEAGIREPASQAWDGFRFRPVEE